MVNVVSIDPRQFSLKGVIVTPNNGSDQETSSEGMSILVDDFQQASLV